MLEKDGAYTVELSKNGKLLESYSTFDPIEFSRMVELFTKKIKPTFDGDWNDGTCENDTFSIHVMTF